MPPLISWTELSQLAQRLRVDRFDRSKFFSGEIFGEVCWDVLLALYIVHCAGQRMSTTELGMAADVKQTTLLRWLDVLADRGLVYRYTRPTDARKTFIALTDSGIEAMSNYLTSVLLRDRPIAGHYPLGNSKDLIG